jgi:hypothetical protein
MTRAIPLGTCEHCDAILFLTTVTGTSDPITFPCVGDESVVVRHAQRLVEMHRAMREGVQSATVVFTLPPYAKFTLNGDGTFEAVPS